MASVPSLDSIDAAGKTVLVRSDLNVPLESGSVGDDYRIRASLPTIRALRERGARVVVCSHLGRPEGRDPELSTAPVAESLATLGGFPVGHVPGVIGAEVARAVKRLGPGEVALLENTRYEPGEKANDPAMADGLAALADAYVLDAFGSAHRAHASTVGVAERLPSAAGLLIEAELSAFESLQKPSRHPYVVVLGGAKISDKLRLIDRPAQVAVNALFKPKISKKFGGRLKAMVSGGAPLNPEIGIFFQSLGLTFLQGYGQTEAAPVISCNRPSAGLRMDTVGPPLVDTEVRIADDGEILVRGELVMNGYWRNEAETARVLKDGWLHTGDIGEFDAAGRIKITDRKKDLIINDKGDNVAPQKIEGMLTLQPEIVQAMIYGDRKPYMVALIVPDPEWTQEWCAANGDACNFIRLAENSEYRTAIGHAIERVNKDLSVTERVRRFILADGPFAIENEQLTPSLKIRRHIIRHVYGERLDALYRS